MSEAARDAKPLYPPHAWGKLAKNPFLQIGSETEEHRQVLRRYWLRSGGKEEVFDHLLPLVETPRSKER